ncbi:MAG: hypothetical protein JNN28_20380 [Saprospiraceae bacterium]|nr:hypothetical protein [Saprospiraceae bacterium]
MGKTWYVFVLAAVFTITYCVQPPDYPETPDIKYLGLSKKILAQGEGYEDSLYVTFSFTDGDGDLGFPESDTTGSVFIRDSRDSFQKPSLQLPYVEPQGAANGISGEITVKLPTTCCIYLSPEGFKYACEDVPVTIQYDSFFYFIKIRDRAGHVSNEIRTETILLRCQ